MFHSRPRGPAPRAEAEEPLPPPSAGATRPGDLSRLVREALEGHRVQMEFQPIAMAGATGPATLFEGFVRILDGGGQVIPATRFMGAVEESTIGRDLDCAALRLGLTALRAHPWLRLAVNASARSLENATWRATLESAMGELGARLTLEVGEGSATLLADRVTRFMAELRPKGLRVVLDDFGIGPLSLRQLRDFCFDGVKIDRTAIPQGRIPSHLRRDT